MQDVLLEPYGGEVLKTLGKPDDVPDGNLGPPARAWVSAMPPAP